MGLLAVPGGGKGQHRKGVQGHKSHVMRFLADFVLEACGDTSLMS